jgi:hypothetical protein
MRWPSTRRRRARPFNRSLRQRRRLPGEPRLFLLPAVVIRPERDQLVHDRLALLKYRACIVVVIGPAIEQTELAIVASEVELPADIAEIRVRQPLSDGETVAIGCQRVRKLALRHLHVANLHDGDREIAL